MKVLKLLQMNNKLNISNLTKSITKVDSRFFSECSNLYSKQFKFETFKNAIFFQGTISDFMSRNKLDCQIHNVYDTVTITLNKNQSNFKTEEVADIIQSFYNGHRDIVNGKIKLDFSLPKNVVVPENNQKIPSSYKYLPTNKVYYDNKI